MRVKKTRIVLAGDSLTEWFDWQGRFPEYEITNLGIAGEPVEGLLGRAGRIIAGVNPPDYLFVMTGINNIAMQDFGIIVPYREMIGRFRSAWPSTRIVIQSVLPVLLEWIEQWRVPEANTGLARLSKELETDYLDVYRAFVDEDGVPLEECLQDDGVHLSQRGYEVWSQVVGEFLEDYGRKKLKA